MTIEEIKNFAVLAHFDLEKDQTLLEADPRLLNVVNTDFDERALEVAPHVGHCRLRQRIRRASF